MDLFLYIPKKNGAGDRLVQATTALSPDGAVSILRTFRQLTSRLRRPVDDRDVVVLLLPTRSHLDEIRTIAPLLERTRLIAILPDQAPETIAQGHRLRPRFLTTADHHFQDVAAVLEKMKRTAKPGPCSQVGAFQSAGRYLNIRNDPMADQPHSISRRKHERADQDNQPGGLKA